MTRLELLAQPSWRPFLHLPGLDALPEPALRAANSFFGFIAEYGLADPQVGDIVFWAGSDPDAEPAPRLELLRQAMAVCVPAFVVRIGEAERLPCAVRSGGEAPVDTVVAANTRTATWEPLAPPARRPPVPRRVSVPPWELPDEMRHALVRMAQGLPANGVVVSGEILKRLREKLCQFAWSAARAGLPATLGEASVLRYHEDIVARGRAGRNGLRWASVRASIEEIHRYARYIGAQAPILRMLADLLYIVSGREQMQKALKHAALARTGHTTLSLLDLADDLLAEAEIAAPPKRRHRMRNGACILGVYSVAPLRNASASLVFGETLFWRNGAWVVDTEIQKTISFNPDPFVMTLRPQHGRFVDAVLQGDRHPRYLSDLREEALRSRRSLFVLPNGGPAAASYIPRIFKALTGNSFTTTRTMLHTDLAVSMGVAGRDTAMIACHQTSEKVAKKYETEAVALSAMARRQGAAAERREVHAATGQTFDPDA